MGQRQPTAPTGKGPGAEHSLLQGAEGGEVSLTLNVQPKKSQVNSRKWNDSRLEGPAGGGCLERFCQALGIEPSAFVREMGWMLALHRKQEALRTLGQGLSWVPEFPEYRRIVRAPPHHTPPQEALCHLPAINGSCSKKLNPESPEGAWPRWRTLAVGG